MTQNGKTRRQFAALTATAVVAATASAATIAPAAAEQGNMEAALGALNAAVEALHRATPNKGGHKERAVQLIQQAIAEVEAGIVFADEHGGG
jgi:hypothetical protein